MPPKDQTNEGKCICNHELAREGVIWLHLSWCEKSSDVKKYKKLTWYKKIFTNNPQNI